MDETQGNGDMASKSAIANEPTHPRTSPEKAKTPRPEKKKQKVRGALLLFSVVVPPPTVVLRPLLRSPLEAHLLPPSRFLRSFLIFSLRPDHHQAAVLESVPFVVTCCVISAVVVVVVAVADSAVFWHFRWPGGLWRPLLGLSEHAEPRWCC